MQGNMDEKLHANQDNGNDWIKNRACAEGDKWGLGRGGGGERVHNCNVYATEEAETRLHPHSSHQPTHCQGWTGPMVLWPRASKFFIWTREFLTKVLPLRMHYKYVPYYLLFSPFSGPL